MQSRFLQHRIASVLALCAGLLSMAPSLAAQVARDRRVEIVARDSMGNALPGVQIVKADNEVHRITNADGRASLLVKRVDDVLLFRKLGFEAAVLRLTPSMELPDTLEVTLTPRVVQLDAAIITGSPLRPNEASQFMDDFWRRRIEGKGKTFTRSEIEELGSVRAVLSTVPGVRLETDAMGRIKGVALARCNGSWDTKGVAWYVDGIRITASDDIPIPAFADTELEGVEIYRGASQLPAETLGSACAAVMFWTRRSL